MMGELKDKWQITVTLYIRKVPPYPFCANGALVNNKTPLKGGTG